MHRYILEQQRHGSIAERGMTLHERLARNSHLLVIWKRQTIAKVRTKFPQIIIEGLAEKGIVVLLPTASAQFLAVLRRELDCVADAYTGEEPRNLRDILYPERGAT